MTTNNPDDANYKAFYKWWTEEGNGNLHEGDFDDAYGIWQAARSSDKGEAVAYMHPISGAIVRASQKIAGVTLDDFDIPLYLAAPQQAIPAGYAIVPIEPTQQMLNEAVLISSCDRHTGRKIDDLHSIFYKAMLSAAPTASIDNGVNDGTDK
jgi:hypothetical protein